MTTETETNKLAVLQQQVTALANPQTSLDQIGAELGVIWQQAEASGDSLAMEYLTKAWQKTNDLAAAHGAANAVAQAALQTAVEIAGQHADLLKAIADPYFTENPIVEGLVQSIRDDMEEWLAYGSHYGGIMDAEPGVTAAENGHLKEIPCEDIDDFLHIVYGDSDDLPEEMFTELADFINMFLPAAREFWASGTRRQAS